ncbi:uncharacterized protein B0P05DRAFT_41190 [Gilbertella persicaria]|uniref:uncharacterized protein n=1 Tax=Gilbertella persicaria TaxID=101096 RepID=UPI002220CD9D|nr:uncharacterized protein B0P05DRAFT_41190 [Gilbertella persicaria]KAI8084013.1 hypothetical protein B0P05DRAFT_41190 [Gilbertella persicaria]
MAQQTTLPFFRQKKITSSLNVPRRYQIPTTVLRASSCLPALVNVIYNLKQAWQIAYRDAGGAIVLQTTQLDYYIAILWCLLAGYWSWILVTSMMVRWLYHHEIKQAMMRLVALVIMMSCISYLFHTLWTNPIGVQLSLCSVLLVINMWTMSSQSSLSQKIETKARLDPQAKLLHLLCPLVIVMVLSSLMLSQLIHTYQYTSNLLFYSDQFGLDQHMASGAMIVLILSTWTPEGAHKRQVLRQSTLKWVDHYRFVMGQPDHLDPAWIAESETYHDILFVPAPDLHHSQKLLSACQWSTGIQYDYLVKTEDDVFVRWDKLKQELTETGKKDNYWKGFVYRNMPVDHVSKDKQVQTDYGMPLLPAFTSGTLTILSRHLVDRVAHTQHPRRMVGIDSIDLALWLFGFDVQPMHDRRIQDDEHTCEKDMIAKRVPYAQFEQEIQAMYTYVLQKRSVCHALDAQQHCAVCYPCHGKQDDWRSKGIVCDPQRGVSPAVSDFQTIPNSQVKDELASLGDHEQWIIQDVLSTHSSIYSNESSWHLLYWVCWTSDPSTFTDRHWRALELVWIHEPEAVIFMISNTLPQSFFRDYTRRGYQIEVVEFNKQNLLNWQWYFGPGTHDWLQSWDRWEKGKFFYWHLTDYIRCLLLYNYGGTYMDMDALWIRAPPDQQLEFIGSDYSQVHSDRAWTLDQEGLYLPQGLMRFKRGWKLFREMAEGAFSAYNYDPECFNCGGPKAITSYVRERRTVLEEGGLTILPRQVLYPYNYLEIHKLLQPSALAEQELKTKIEPFSWNIHMFGKMTNHLPVQPHSVIDLVFQKFDLDLPHLDTQTHAIVSSTQSTQVPMRLVAPRDYVYRAVSDRMRHDDQQSDNLLRLQPAPGHFQGLNILYVRGGPDRMAQVTIDLETAIGRTRMRHGMFEKHKQITMMQVNMKQVNSVLGSLEFSPTKLMLANGGRDRIKISVTYQHMDGTIETDQAQITVIVMEPVEEDEPFNDKELLDQVFQ